MRASTVGDHVGVTSCGRMMCSELRTHLIFIAAFEARERSLHCWKLGTSWWCCWAIAKWECYLLIEGSESVGACLWKPGSALEVSPLLFSLPPWHLHHPYHSVLPLQRPRSNGAKCLWMETNETMSWINLPSFRLVFLGYFINASDKLSTLRSWWLAFRPSLPSGLRARDGAYAASWASLWVIRGSQRNRKLVN